MTPILNNCKYLISVFLCRAQSLQQFALAMKIFVDISQKPRDLGYLNFCIDAGLLDALALALKTDLDHQLTKHTFNTL